MSWQCERLRLTAFTNEVVSSDKQNWWKEVVSSDPDKTTDDHKSGSYIQIGEYEEGQLALGIQGKRIDWIYSVKIELDKNREIIPSIGNFDTSLEEFIKLTDKLLRLDNLPIINRLAFGASLFDPVKNHIVGYKNISKFLPSVKLSPKSSDFSYRINRPRDSKIDIRGLRINRLTTWVVSVYRKIGLTGIAEVTGEQDINDLYALHLELDINTTADKIVKLPKKRLIEIRNELFEMGKEISIKGDIR